MNATKPGNTSGWLNRDTILAILLLVGCGVLMTATFEIREPDYGQLSPATWPRVIIGLLTLLCVIYLVQSIKNGPDTGAPIASVERPPGIAGFFAYWRNVFICFTLFFAYLYALPWVGMLVGGVLFVFFLLNALGGWSPRQLMIHVLIALVSVGGMWCLFTYGLGVLLPGGELFS